MAPRTRTSVVPFALAFAAGLACGAPRAAAAEAPGPAVTPAAPGKEAAPPRAAPATMPPWTADFAAAKAQARKEGKDILIFFTGSDWCAPCNQQKQEVYATEPFKAAAAKRFVLVECDLPEKAKLPEATEKQNRAMAKEYQAGAVPVTILADADGNAYARIDGYTRLGSPEKYYKYIEGFVDLHAEIGKLAAAADKAKGIERAKLLDQVLGLWDRCRVKPKNWQALVDEIQKLDETDEAGLKLKYAKISRLGGINQLRMTGKHAEAAKACEIFIADFKPTGGELQPVLFNKGHSMWRAGDKEEGLKVMQAAVDAAPDSPGVGGMKNTIRFLVNGPRAPTTKPPGAK